MFLRDCNQYIIERVRYLSILTGKNLADTIHTLKRKADIELWKERN